MYSLFKKYIMENEPIEWYKPLSRESSLSPISKLAVELTEEQIDTIVFYKRLIISKDDIILKNDNIPDEVINHIINYNYDVLNPNLAYCIDDRTTEKQIKWVFIPWWTDWILAAAFHLLKKKNINLEPQVIYDILIDTIWEWNYYSHSDTHNINIEWRIWCWHCNHTFNNGDHSLHLRQEDIDFMIYSRKKAKNEDNIDILEWDHNAQWVIFIDNIDSLDKLSIIPKWKKEEYFIYNRNAERNILSRFIEKLNEHDNFKHITLNENELKDIAFKAYLSTLEHLWAWELPHYTIKYNIANSKYQLKSIWNVDKFIKKHTKNKKL